MNLFHIAAGDILTHACIGIWSCIPGGEECRTSPLLEDREEHDQMDCRRRASGRRFAERERPANTRAGCVFSTGRYHPRSGGAGRMELQPLHERDERLPGAELDRCVMQ